MPAISPSSPIRTDERLSRIVRLLSNHAMMVVSGTKIADEIGISRSEVWRLVQQLRSLGVDIAGHPATGYRLERVPDLLLPDVISPLVRGTIFAGHLEHFFRIPSTNPEALRAAQDGAPEGTVYFAEEQTAGRGRGGHVWVSPPSTGIYLSVILRPQLPPADVLGLSLMAGLAAQSAVDAVTGLRPDLRWPNDVLIGDKKFCGILTELHAEATRVLFAVVGIGMNVNQQEFPEELQAIATSLRIASGREWSRVELAAALLRALDREYRNLANMPEILRRFEESSTYARGRRVHVDEAGGYEGVTEGLDNRGFLRVRTNGSVRTVISGGVRAVD